MGSSVTTRGVRTSITRGVKLRITEPRTPGEKRSGKVFALVLLAAGILAFLFRNPVQSYFTTIARRNSAVRQVTFICLALSEHRVTAKEICARPLPEVPAFQEHFRIIAEKDQAWYEQHHWRYYPETQCAADGEITFTLMDKRFACDGPRGKLLKEISSNSFVSLAYAEEEQASSPDPEAEASSEGEFPKFSQRVTLNPIWGLPSLLSLVVDDPKQITQARALMVIDGELLAVPLRYHEPSQAFRGIFPTPEQTLSFQFQLIFSSGKSALSAPLAVEPRCEGGTYRPEHVKDEAIKDLLAVQAKEQRLSYALDAFEKVLEKEQ